MPTNPNTPLNRAGTQASKEIVPVLKNILVGRRFASINPYLKGDGKTAFEYTHVSDLSDAFTQWKLPSGSGEHRDGVTTSFSIVKIPVIYKEFETEMADIMAWENRTVSPGQENNLNLITANFAARKVAEQEEEIIFNGWKPDGTNYSIKGFTQAAKNSVSGGSIATVGTMFGYISEAIGKLEEDGVIGENNSYNVGLPTAIMAKLRTLRFTNGDTELSKIQELLGNGKLYVTPNLSGTAVVLPVDTARQHVEFLNPVDYRIEFAHPKYDNIGSVEGIAYELFTPAYTRVDANGQTEAICKITSLTA